MAAEVDAALWAVLSGPGQHFLIKKKSEERRLRVLFNPAWFWREFSQTSHYVASRLTLGGADMCLASPLPLVGRLLTGSAGSKKKCDWPSLN